MNLIIILQIIQSFYYAICNGIQLPLSTQKSQIIDSKGNAIKLSCVNLYGAHMERYVINGLDLLEINVMAKNITQMGFNCVRLTYSLEQFYKNPLICDSFISANPQLYGLTSMQIFDKTIEALTNQKIMVILNNHMSDAGWCCGNDDNNGMWYNDNYSEKMWLNALEQLTLRYLTNAYVIGNDLRNELRNSTRQNLCPTWGSFNETTDWRLAATKAANLILNINPKILIFVEGINYANDLSSIKQFPIKLIAENQLVYSWHIYSWQLRNFSNYKDFKYNMDESYNYIQLQDIAPLWLGEFGTNQQDQYWTYLIRYLQETNMSWSYWSFNGYKNNQTDDESFGIVDITFQNIRDPWKLSDLQKIQQNNFQ